MNLKSQLLYSQNWNIGFCEQTPDELIALKKLKKVQWMKHPYRDRWFADPYIYKVTDDEIVVFVEECPIVNPKGILCELHLDRKTKRLKERFVLLELDTHLSYPAIIEHDGKTYVYPENGASGRLYIYEYDAENHRLVNPRCILDEALADSTILKHEDKYYLIATKVPETQEKAYLYESNSLFGPYTQLSEAPVQSGRDCSRPAGNWFKALGQLYRPSQNCIGNYGAAISIMSVGELTPWSEEMLFAVKPLCFRYNRGIHTINFAANSDSEPGVCVVDSYGYLHPFIGNSYKFCSYIKREVLHI